MANRAKNISSTIGDKIKELRITAGSTQKDLAICLNKAESTVRMWELGKSEPDLETVKLIAKKFSVTTDYLLGITSEFSQFSHISGRLNSTMQSAGIGAEYLVEKLNNEYSRLQIANFLDGRVTPNDDFITKFAEVCGIHPDSLYGLTYTINGLTPAEERMITAYRNNPGMQAAVDKLLEISPSQPERSNIIADDVFETINNQDILPPIVERIDTK